MSDLIRYWFFWRTGEISKSVLQTHYNLSPLGLIYESVLEHRLLETIAVRLCKAAPIEWFPCKAASIEWFLCKAASIEWFTGLDNLWSLLRYDRSIPQKTQDSGILGFLRSAPTQGLEPAAGMHDAFAETVCYFYRFAERKNIWPREPKPVLQTRHFNDPESLMILNPT